jgi:hypothetical protein
MYLDISGLMMLSVPIRQEVKMSNSRELRKNGEEGNGIDLVCRIYRYLHGGDEENILTMKLPHR